MGFVIGLFKGFNRLSPHLCGVQHGGKHYACFLESDVYSLIHGKDTVLVMDVEKSFEPTGLQHCDFIIVNKDECSNKMEAYFVELKRSMEDEDFSNKVIDKAKETIKWFRGELEKSFLSPINMQIYYVVVLGDEGYNLAGSMLVHLKSSLIKSLRPEFVDCYVKPSYTFVEF